MGPFGANTWPREWMRAIGTTWDTGETVDHDDGDWVRPGQF